MDHPVPRYSQCGEDQLLAALLAELGDFCAPTIAELGAGDPFEYSNSRYLIELGWSALLVEANPDLVQRLRSVYGGAPEVDVRQAVLAPQEGPVRFHRSKLHWALSGVGGVSYPGRHGPDDVEIEVVTASPASGVLSDWVDRTGPLGVLAIDLEGLDGEVLTEVFEATDLRPDLIILEALTPEEFAGQRDLLRAHGYALVRVLYLSTIWVRRDLATAAEVVAVGRAAEVTVPE